ncbi:MAG: glycosyltransferase family 1 protein [Flavobacteriaceae bacterium]
MIIVNARFLTQEISGVQRFAIEICRELKKRELNLDFVAPVNIVHEELALEFGVRKIGFLKGHLWEQITLQKYVCFKKKTILISFCNTAPIFIKRQIVTIHDLSFRIYPEWNSKLFVLVYNFIIPRIAHKSKHIITVSETSKKELIKELGVKQQKISVVYNAVSSVFEKRTIPNTAKYQKLLKEDYIMTVSSHHPRKNLEKLVEAFLKISDKEINLYIIGNVNKNYTKVNGLDKQASSQIKILKNLNDTDLNNFFINTKLFVYPSFYEGFGIPIIEALSHKVPVCVSDIDVFHEVCGDNVTYFNPHDVNDIKEKIEIALNTKNKSEIDLKKYSWEKSSIKVKNLLLSQSKN